MGLFDTGDKARLAQLFATSDLDELVWRERVDDVADGRDFVDVVLSSPKPAFLMDTRKVGLTYWPDGPVVRGVQNYTAGAAVTFSRVPVKRGGTLALAASTDWGASLPARVDVVPAGAGAGMEREREDRRPSPLEDVFRGAGAVAGFVVVLALVYLAVKAEG